jgi:hypothetical protein
MPYSIERVERTEPQFSSDSQEPDDKKSVGYDNINVLAEINSIDLVSLHAQIEYSCSSAAHPDSESRGGGVYSLTIGKIATLQNQDSFHMERSGFLIQTGIPECSFGEVASKEVVRDKFTVNSVINGTFFIYHF